MRKTCQVCKRKLYQYVCPSCEIVYCSLECYKRHNDKCVNIFLDNQVKQSIKNNQLTDLEKKEFKFKLKKLYDKNVDTLNSDIGEAWDEPEVESDEREGDKKGDDEDEVELDEREGNEEEDEEEVGENESERVADEDGPKGKNQNHLKKWCISNRRYKVLTELAKSDQLKLESLTKTEQKQFFSFLKSNDMNLYFAKFEPWWLNCVIKKMKTPEHICCGKNVSENVIYIIIEILYTYCYLLRIFNKSMDNKELCHCFLYLSSSLNRFNLPESNVYNTIHNLFQRILENDELAREKKILYNVITDITTILNLKDLFLRCLYETKKFFKKEIKKMNSKKEKMDDNSKSIKKHIALLQEQKNFKYVNKKITFLYSYANYHYDNFVPIMKQLSRFYNEHTKEKNSLVSNEKREIVFSKENL
ncbi:hypothetical protein, conserved [Plasmodium gonderi]|uniref:HIT-type domain-containing protein n=1 Tax=Plasmodium gonderi TaxID=77519 RepID=A0A1Y1JCH1_PLAGO|nr:hypothetical protein, conserved [Plasmodium gonderi]GAW80186.1 hypothetical protein, conserved [Plasmodium gonderi]